MKLEDQVVSLELAKKLKELGVKQESLFWWVNGLISDSKHAIKCGYENKRLATKHSICSAFTVAELGEMLPETIGVAGEEFFFDTCPVGDKWRMTYTNSKRLEYIECFEALNEADARAKTLIYLLENVLITPA